MADENMEFTDPDTGEVHPLNATSLVSNVRDVLLSRRKMQTQATVWSKLSQSDQQDEITAMQELARDLVGSVVVRVAEKGLVCANVEISNFAVDVDKGEVKIVSKGFANDEMLTSLAHAKGKVARITVIDEGQFNAKSTMVKPDPDQPSLLPDGPDPDSDAPDDVQLDGDGSIEDPEDLHEVERSKQYLAGYSSRMGGYIRARNPFDLDENEGSDWSDWNEGWDACDADGNGADLNEALGAPEAEAVEDEAPAEPEADDTETTPAVSVKTEGQKARLDNAGPDENPFDGGTESHAEWAEGYESADAEINQLIEAGRKAALDGKSETDSPWRKGTDGARFWLEGFKAGQVEVEATPDAEDVAAEGVSDDLDDDSFKAGVVAAERGETRDANPNPEGGPKHRFWNEGYDSFVGSDDSVDGQDETD